MKLSEKKLDFLVVFFLVTVVFVIFFGYLTGKVAPSWDFYGDYHSQAYSWWDLGSFFYPTTYMPYLLSGFPAHLGLQISSFYLPVGFVSEFFSYTILNAARLQAISIAIGIIGIYFLSRKFEISRIASIAVSLGYLFSAGFFSNATHIDIVRAWIFLPLLLLLMFPRDKINYKLIPVAGIVWFQFFVGSYPGNIASYAYLFLAWFVILWFRFKSMFKPTLIFTFITVLTGILLSGIKWIPYLIDGQSPQIDNQVVVNRGIISTFLFPYSGSALPGDSILPNDITQRTFFVIPLILLFAFFARKNTTAAIFGFTFVSIGLILGIDTGIFGQWQQKLPLLDISRFRTIDFKPAISLGIAILGGVGFDYLRKTKFREIFDFKNLINSLLGFSIFSYLILMAFTSELSNNDLKIGLKWIAISIVAFVFINFSKFLIPKILINILFIVSILYLGNQWAHQFTAPWQAPRLETEQFYFGASNSELLKNQSPAKIDSRPARIAPDFPIPYPAGLVFQTFNRHEIKREFTMGGYANIKGQFLFDEYINSAMDGDKSSILEFLKKESEVRVADNTDSNNDNCISDNDCVDNTVKAKVTAFEPGIIEIDINDLKKDSILYVNELNWNGWKAKSCNLDNLCNASINNNVGNGLLLNFEVPSGTSKVTLYYETPGIKTAWILFWFAVLLNLISTVIIRKSDTNP